jgi:hypothetical protein
MGNYDQRFQENGYRAFGLGIKSDFPLPEFMKTNSPLPHPDVTIVCGDLSGLWVKLSRQGRYYAAYDRFVLFHIREVGLFKVEKGCSIVVSPAPHADPGAVRLYLMGSCLGIILMQRHIFPLHGSALNIDGQVWAITGESGAGKSTLTAELIRSGYRMLTDDVIAVSFNEQGTPLITPSFPQQKLWKETLRHFGEMNRPYDPLYQRVSKFSVPVTEGYDRETHPLTGIFELVKSGKNEPQLYPVSKMEELQLLFKHTYRGFFIPDMKLSEWHFRVVTRLAGQFNLYRLERPSGGVFTAQRLAEMMLNQIHDKITMRR